MSTLNSVVSFSETSLRAELDWLREVLDTKARLTQKTESPYDSIFEIAPPDLNAQDSFYASLVARHELNFSERFVLILALAPHLYPSLLDVFKGGATMHGGQLSKTHRGFIPTGETGLFVLAGSDVDKRMKLYRLFESEHPFVKENILQLGTVEAGEPRLSGTLSVSQDFIDQLIYGKKMAPAFGNHFPAKRITTEMNWEDLVLTPQTLLQIDELRLWLKHYNVLRNDFGLRKQMKPGYKALLHGPPGTGKTLAATLLGKDTGREVFRIDLSMIVSKYIGETEKNLAKVFDVAQSKNWILFFDEADALFGKRTAANSSNDRFANQQTAYLLQRIEDFPGVVILATNLNANMDEAFTRRFQSMVHFRMPSPDERQQLWEQAFSGTCALDPSIDLRKISEEYELAGGAIINVLRSCALAAVRKGEPVVTLPELLAAIRKEFRKENKTIAPLHA